MKEAGNDSVKTLRSAMSGAFTLEAMKELSSCGLVKVSQDAEKIALTEEGEAKARRLIRAHRLAERLLHDVLGGEYESGACEFEHTVSSDLIDGICTLLGHPRQCPHGLAIPEGECCKNSHQTESSFIAPLTTGLKLGQSARVAYVNCRNDRQIHKLEGLCVRPGAIVKLHQDYPAYVIECEGATIALDKEVAHSICVWKDIQGLKDASEKKVPGKKSDLKGLRKIFALFQEK